MMQMRTALKKAVALLGPKATVNKGVCGLYLNLKRDGVSLCTGSAFHAFPCPGGLPYFAVGRIMLWMFNEILGEGNTWEEALENARKRLER